MLLINARTSGVVASSVEIADTHAARRRGLLGRDGLPDESALVLPSCNAVHTIGMRFAIDVAFVDASGCVCKIVRNVGRWRIAIAPRARTTIELAAGRVDQAGVDVGDRVYLEVGEAEGGRASAGAPAPLDDEGWSSRLSTAARPACSGS